MSRRQLEAFIVSVVVIADQGTKALIRSRFNLHDELELIPGLLSLTRVHNTGAAFGLLDGTDLPWKTVALGLVAATDRKSTRLNSSHVSESRMPSSA